MQQCNKMSTIKLPSNNTNVYQDDGGDYLHMLPEQNLLQRTLRFLLLHIFIVEINCNKRKNIYIKEKLMSPLKWQVGKSFPIIG